jgi:hypothetical protein
MDTAGIFSSITESYIIDLTSKTRIIKVNNQSVEEEGRTRQEQLLFQPRHLGFRWKVQMKLFPRFKEISGVRCLRTLNSKKNQG